MMQRMVLILMLGVLGFAGRAMGDTASVRQRATASGPTVTLGEVARLDGDYAKQLGGRVVARFDDGQDTMTLDLGAVRRALGAYGVNWGRLSLSGFVRCELRRVKPAAKPAPVKKPGPAAMPTQPVKSAGAAGHITTLREQITGKLCELTGVGPDDLVIDFRGSDEELARLDRRTRGVAYEVRSRSDTGLGRVPMVVREADGATAGPTFYVDAEVKRRTRAVVATGTVSKGRRFTEGNVAVREVLLDKDRGEPVHDIDKVLGQEAGGLLRAGAVVYPEAVAPPVLVERGELVTVRARAGQLVIRTVARATEAGARGQKITLRNESTRATFTATVTGRREASL